MAFSLQPEMKWLPEWRYNRATNELMLMCPNCNFHTPAFTEKNAVIAFWSLCNWPGDAHTLMMWKRDYDKQNQAAENEAA